MFTPENKKSPSEKESYLIERAALFASIFFLAFGVGLITDGKKIYQNQLRLSQRVDFKATLNPYQN
jgi:hypothetical protein